MGQSESPASYPTRAMERQSSAGWCRPAGARKSLGMIAPFWPGACARLQLTIRPPIRGFGREAPGANLHRAAARKPWEAASATGIETCLTVTDFGGQADADMTRQNGHDPVPRKEVDHGRRNRDTVVARASYHLLAHLGRRLSADHQRPPGVPTHARRVLPQTPELFPANFAHGYELKDDRMSAKQEIPIRRILLKDGTAYSIRPSFLMPYMTARTADVEGPLFLRKFGVPFWALAHVFGGDPMYWYRLECGLGRFSVVGTTVRQATLPEHSAGRRASSNARRPEGLHRHDRRRRVLPGGGAGRGGGDRRPEGRLRGLQGRGPRHRPQVRPQDRQHRRLERDASGLESAVHAGGHPSVLLARRGSRSGTGPST